MKNSLKQVTICILGSLLLAIFISVMAVLFSVRVGFISDGMIVNSINKVNYYGIVYREFMDKCEAIAIPNGLGGDVFVPFISKEQIYNDGSNYLKAQLRGGTFEMDREGYKKKLKENIYKYVKQNDLTAEGDMEQIIESFCDEIMECYVEMIRFPHGEKIGFIFRRISDYFPYVFAAMLLFALAVLWILIRQNRHNKGRFFRYVSYSTLSGAFSVCIVPILCMFTRFYRRLQIYPEYMYQFIISYIEHGLKIMLIVGMILFAVSIALVELSELWQKSLEY